MLATACTWACHNPLWSVGILAGLSVAVGLLLVPNWHTLSGDNHPRT